MGKKSTKNSSVFWVIGRKNPKSESSTVSGRNEYPTNLCITKQSVGFVPGSMSDTVGFVHIERAEEVVDMMNRAEDHDGPDWKVYGVDGIDFKFVDYGKPETEPERVKSPCEHVVDRLKDQGFMKTKTIFDETQNFRFEYWIHPSTTRMFLVKFHDNGLVDLYENMIEGFDLDGLLSRITPDRSETR